MGRMALLEEVGPGVETLETGDHVVLALVPSCGECDECRRDRPNFCSLGARMATEGTLADGTSPAVGTGFWYLIRGESACGQGTFGSAAQHGAATVPRVTETCP